MTTIFSEITSRRMLALTKAALHGTIPDENLFVGAGEADWTELFEHSVAQGVMVLSLHGAMLLPKDLQPPLPLKLRWIAGMEVVEKRYRHCLETAEDLAAHFRENHIRMLLLKGIALSRFYPVPNSREFGDIDIFLCGKAAEGDVLLESMDAILERSPDGKCTSLQKHICFSYRGVLIENHHTLLDHNNYKNFRHSDFLEKRLIMILTEAGMMNETDLAASHSQNETLLFPPPDFDVLFVTLHLLRHFSRKIVLRYLCDLTVLFTAYRGKINFSRYRETLSKADLLKVADAFISLSVKYLGLDPADAPPYESNVSLENRIWNDLLNLKAPPPLPKEKRTFFNVVIYKIRVLRSRYWKSELVLPGQFRKRILHSLFFYLRHPTIVGKLKD